MLLVYWPFRFKHLVHPETDADGRIKHPFRVGLSNTITALVPVALTAAGCFWKYRGLRDSIAWWVIAAVPTGLTAVAFGHAYLGAAIGGRRANNAFMIALVMVLVGGCWLLTQFTASL